MPRSSSRARRALRVSRPLLLVLVVAALWRLPSLIEPPWINDEGTYFAIAAAMAHGLRLYSGVWENKPPGLYGLYLAVYHSLGPSLIAVRVLALFAALGTTVLTYSVARFWVSKRGALVAALLAGLLFDVPFLEGTTANAEIFLAFFVALGMFLGVKRRPELAALAMVCALAFKAVAVLDASALGIWFLFRERDLLARYIGTGLVTIGASLVYLRLAGILGSFLHDAVLYNLGYVGHANGGTVPWLLIVKVTVLVVVTFWLRNAPLPGLWLVWAIAGSLASGRIFGHYFLEAVVPFAIVVILVVERGWGGALSVVGLMKGGVSGRAQIAPTAVWVEGEADEGERARADRAGRPGANGATVPTETSSPFPPRPLTGEGVGGEGMRRALIILPIAYLCLAILSALSGWGLAASGHDSIFARRLQYYANAVRYVLGTESAATYRSEVDDHVNRNIAVARMVGELPRGRLLVWGNTPWVYVLSKRLPATPYTSALRSPEVPGETATLRRAVRSGRPSVVVIIRPAAPPLGSARFGLNHRYRVTGQLGNALVYVRRSSA